MNIKHCQSCLGVDLNTVLDMGEQPLAEKYSKSEPSFVRSSSARKWYPLILVECLNCHLIQLDSSSHVNPQLIFPQDHPYSTGNSVSLRKHFSDLARELTSSLHLGENDLVVDIGANDGTLLSAFDPVLHRVAVEPTGQAKKCAEKSLTVYHEFFTLDTAQAIGAEFKRARVITASNVLAHVSDPHDFLDGVYSLLDSDGVFVTENHHVDSILQGLQFDTIYHEHLRYFSVESLGFLLSKHGFTISEVRNIPTHGGSFRVYAKKRNSSQLMFRASQAASSLYKLLDDIHGVYGVVYGVGATTRATPLIHFAHIAKFIDCVVEVKGSEKIGSVMPGTSIPILDEEILFSNQPSHVLLFSWHMADVLIPKLRESGYKGEIIIPLPVPRVVRD